MVGPVRVLQKRWRHTAVTVVALLVIAVLRRSRRRLLTAPAGDNTTISRRGLRKWTKRLRVNEGSRSGEGKFTQLTHGRTHYILRRPPGWTESSTKPTVLLFHGFGMFSFVYKDVMADLLEHGHSVLVFDWYGHGYSDVPDVPLTVSLMVQQAQELVSVVLGPSALVSVMGHSMGGLLAGAFTAAAPEGRVTKLVLVCPAGTLAKNMSFRRTFTLSIVHGLASVITIPIIGKYLLIVGTKLLGLTSVSSLTSQMGGVRPEAEQEEAKKKKNPLEQPHQPSNREASHSALSDMMRKMKTVLSDNEMRQGTARRFSRMTTLSLGTSMHLAKHNPRFAGALSSILSEMNLFGDRTDVFASAARTKVPTLIVWGDEDEYIPVECCDELSKVMPESQILLYKGADHFVFLNKPAEFCSAVNRFLAQGELGKAMSSANLR